ncbi:uncharacterized protein OGAPODRAFT_8130 [Ogataea polymorpha]|uniref:uncharacterized protein n=1 Tax=Ogataea polymorpha TaxID=460523 RepID=UPI0007F43FCD|nr:uncharacterized protein OGAPODRAFT_8130 [Ogataea polymorpha]OBA16886.1 hypothetical protein OGAPODRAFT_8130 [Ogataea polymorpha]
MSLGFDLKVVLLSEDGDKNEDGSINATDMQEYVLKGIDTMEKMNEWFDRFDEQVAYPNEGNIKYDVGSDGVVVVIVKTHEVRSQVEDYIGQTNNTDRSNV